MSTQNDTFSEIIDITLYRYNSIDLKLWGIILRGFTAANHGSDDSRVVSATVMREYITKYFKKDINRFHAVSDTTIHKEATSIYFIWQIFDSMPNLKYFRVNLNSNSSYNRIVKVDQAKTIKYDIKILRGFIRVFDMFNSNEVNLVNSVLFKAGLLQNNQHFKLIKVKDFLNQLDLYLSENNNAEVFSVTNAFISRLEGYEADNPEMLLITDKESDI
tara:strand:- start:507 stop:1157 length:651 start_codon:yes stop_codon:yes gene_type:complete